MVVLNRIYTRTGDDGTTALGTGERRKKYDLRIASYGTVDEVNAAIGLARLATAADAEIDAMLGRIQNDLFDVGADLCVPGTAADRLRLTETAVERLEAEVRQMNAALPPLTSFILPGGTDAAAQAHMGRVAVRRAERAVAQLEDANPTVRRFVNRLSDHLFVLARVLNENGSADVLWVPGANR